MAEQLHLDILDICHGVTAEIDVERCSDAGNDVEMLFFLALPYKCMCVHMPLECQDYVKKFQVAMCIGYIIHVSARDGV